MGFGALRNIVRPLSRTLISRLNTTSPAPLPPVFTSPTSLLLSGSAFSRRPQWLPLSNHLHSLTDTRFPKRRPSDKPRRKRASMKPPGPYAWVQYVPGEPILPNRPNEGSVKRRNEKKRLRQHRAFILVCTRRTNYWDIESVSICGWQRFPCPKLAPAILIASSYTLFCSNCLSITPILKPKLAFPALYNLLQNRLY